MRTNKLNFALLILIILSACGNHTNSRADKFQSNESKIDSESLFYKTDSIGIAMKDKNLLENAAIWMYDCMNDTIKQIRTVKEDSLTSEILISIVNREYQEKVKLDFVKISNDTIYVKIDNSDYLTQQMGTTGAIEFMITTTFTLTEIPNVKFVNFDFEFGDHASPGTYYRKYYLDWLKINKEVNK